MAIVTRKNGRIEFYSDYMLVHEFYDEKKICVDIKTDDQTFYFKFMEFTKESIDS